MSDAVESEPHADEALDSEMFVQSLARGLQVIRAFDAETPRMTLSEVSRRVGLSRAAVRRLLSTLLRLGYVWSDGKSFELTPRILELGYTYLSGLGLPEIAQPHLEELSVRTRLSASVCVLVGTEIAYIARVPTRRIMSVAINIGTRFPAYPTSMGRVLLAGLDEDVLAVTLDASSLTALTSATTTSRAALEAEIVRVREQGWSVVDQELEDGLRSMAAPILDRSGRVVAAVNVASHASGDAGDFVGAVLPHLRHAADRIGADLALLRQPPPHPLTLLS